MQIKKLLFLFMLFPNFAFGAADSCTNPSAYTVDRRCYVTDAQKKVKPYNAVVSVGEDWCTGTIVRENGKNHVYTAKHCTGVKNGGLPVDELNFTMQNGATFVGKKNNVGNYDIEKGERYWGDWAIYTVPSGEKDVPYVEISDRVQFGVGFLSYDYSARDIGYGVLKIMSDEEIRVFKRKYSDWLGKGDFPPESIDDDSVIYTSSTKPQNFLSELRTNDPEYYRGLFKDKKLKVSYCEYNSVGAIKNCQGWSGNSGGGIFDVNGNIMAIRTRAPLGIGGKHHAGRDSEDGTAQINLLEMGTFDWLIKNKDLITK